MNEILNLIKKGESEKVEFKPSLSDLNRADNMQIYNGSTWFNVSNKYMDGTSYGLAIACDIPADTSLSDIDFQVRVPTGVTEGSYGAILQFVAYSNISGCTVGTYFVP